MATIEPSKEKDDMSKHQAFEHDCNYILADMEKKIDSVNTLKKNLLENYKKSEIFISQEEDYKEEVLSYISKKVEAYAKFGHEEHS